MPGRLPFPIAALPLPSTRPSTGRRIGMLSTYPPKLCGLATFAAALENELRRAGNQVDMIRVDDGDHLCSPDRPVVAELLNGSASSVRNAAAVLSRCDVAIIQHEYGIYGGADGDEIIDLLTALRSPAIVVLHTVPLHPSEHQRSVLESVCELAAQVVVMAEMARTRLISLYTVDASKVVTIPHGASTPTIDPPGTDPRVVDPDAGVQPPQLLTWGLLGPGKGIEHTINALAMLRDVVPAPRYTVAGVTHPKVFASQGDQYRRSLVQRATSLGIGDSVSFDDKYRDVAQLTRFVASATAVVLPYESRDQVTSGVLVDALAAGRPVIATAFPHAVELLGSGAGIVVPHGDPLAMADAIRLTLTDDDAIDSMATEARRLAPSFSWSAVAAQYLGLADDLVQTAASIAI
ncbi:MAG: glycosyltransferase [Ilumatobacteraceae bacterium]